MKVTPEIEAVARASMSNSKLGFIAYPDKKRSSV